MIDDLCVRRQAREDTDVSVSSLATCISTFPIYAQLHPLPSLTEVMINDGQPNSPKSGNRTSRENGNGFRAARVLHK